VLCYIKIITAQAYHSRTSLVTTGNKLLNTSLKISNNLIKPKAIMRKLTLFVLLAFFAGACASTKPPTQKITQVETSIKQAEQVGADDYAALEIREARKKLDQARTQVSQEKYEDAKLTAEKAMVDAELAQIKTLSAKSQRAVQQLRESIKALQEEIQNNLDKERG